MTLPRLARCLAASLTLLVMGSPALPLIAAGAFGQPPPERPRNQPPDRGMVQLRAAQALYEMGDEAAFRWAADVIAQRRTTDAKKPDIRAQVVRDLVELGGERARGSLAEALAAGPGNDWVAAWTAVGLLELGDLAQLPAVETALGKEDWQLDPRGFRSVWRAIKPFVSAALTTAVRLAAAHGFAVLDRAEAVEGIAQAFAADFGGEEAAARAAEVRAALLRASLIRFPDAPATVELVRRAAADPDPAVRFIGLVAQQRPAAA